MSDYKVDISSPIPKYYQVYHSLRERIESGEFKAGDALPTTRQLTESYGVSHVTIAKVMDMLQVEKVIKRQQGKGVFVLGRPTIAKEPKGLIAILHDPMPDSLPELERPFLRYATSEGIEHHLAEHNYSIHMTNALPLTRKADAIIETVLENGVAGLIFYTQAKVNQHSFQQIQKLVEQGFPVVLYDRYYRDLNTDCVLFNDEEVGFQLTESLIQKGHERIGFILTPEAEATSVNARLNGYKRALTAYSLPFDEIFIFDTYTKIKDKAVAHSIEADLDIKEKLVATNITAVLAANQGVSEAFIFDLMKINNELLNEYNLGSQMESRKDGPPPQEISIEIAMIGERVLSRYSPFVSLIAQQSGRKLGVAAAELLIGRIEGTITGPPQTRTVPMEISVF